MITTNPAAALGVPDYGLRVGGPADLVVFDAPSEADALRLVAPRTLVLRGGRVVARTDAGRAHGRLGRRRGAGHLPAQRRPASTGVSTWHASAACRC